MAINKLQSNAPRYFSNKIVILFTSLIILFTFLLYSRFFSSKVDVQAQNSWTCTMVLGYSQVGLTQLESPGPGYGEGWYVAPDNTRNFETLVDDDRWQLLWESGHGVDQWQNASAIGWNRWANREYPWFASPCTTDFSTPDRIILSVSGPYGTDLNLWKTNIEAAITTILQQIPSAQLLVLEPVVGGPNHQTCPCNPDPGSIMGCGCDTCDGINVRASQQHPFIDTAIGQVLQDIRNGVYSPPGGVEVVAGFSPEAAACTDYYDGIGHLTTQGAEVVGVIIAQYYSGQVPTPTPSPTPFPIPGDANGDCKVDGFDYVYWWQNFGKSVGGGPSQGDFDENGKVDGFDYVIWWQNFGTDCGEITPTPTPVLGATTGDGVLNEMNYVFWLKLLLPIHLQWFF